MLVFVVIDTYTDKIKKVYTTYAKAQKWVQKNGNQYSIEKHWAI